jgi:hypothetical protein
MPQQQAITDLEQLLDRIDDSVQGDERVSLEAMVSSVGRRSFGPLLLLAGLVTLSPIGDIPGVPTMVALLVLSLSLQLVFRRKHIWLPGWLLRRSISRTRLCKALKWLRRPARFIDRFLRPRITFLTHDTGAYVVAVVSAAIACAMPLMEVVPFTATAAGAALTAFGLALIAHDGALAVFAFVFTAATVALITYGLI